MHLSNYLENRLIDFLLRAQAFVPPANLYMALYTVADDDTGGAGTEVSGGSYARVEIPCSLANWAGTQSAGSTTASTGTNGTTSNNNPITFPTPTADWGQIEGMALFDASVGGNPWIIAPLTTPKTVNNGDPAPVFDAGDFQFQIDDNIV